MNTAALSLNWAHLGPELIVLFGALVVTVFDAFSLVPNENRRSWMLSLSVLACGAAAAYARFVLWGIDERSFGDLFIVDGLAIAFKLVILLGAALSLLLADRWLGQHDQTSGGFFALLLIAVMGMMVLVSAADLVTLFLGLELMSIPIYVLAAADRDKGSSVEAGLKYLVLGSFATGILLFGASLLYGGSGTLDLEEIRTWVTSGHAGPLGAMGSLLVLIGLGFKVSAAPFHMWTPDIYEGAPTPTTAFMSAGVKAAAFAVLLRVFGGSILHDLELANVLAVLAALTMVVGNVAALAQNSVKRMLAYSSIAHAGYLLLGVLPGTADGSASVIVYTFGYTLMTAASFGILVLVAKDGSASVTYDDIKGLGRSRPWAAVAMTIAVLSLAGMPPTVGFIGKFFLFRAALEGGYLLLAILGVLTSAVSLGYYLRVVMVMWFDEPEGEVVPAGAALALGLGFTSAAIIVAGLLPARLIELALQAAGA